MAQDGWEKSIKVDKRPYYVDDQVSSSAQSILANGTARGVSNHAEILKENKVKHENKSLSFCALSPR